MEKTSEGIRNQERENKMQTLSEIFEQSTKEKNTLSNIAELELKDVDGFEFVESPFCTFLHKVKTNNSYIVYFRYDNTNKADMNSLNNGYYKATIMNNGELYDVEQMNGNRLISK